jgi:glutathionylspermidine synthase
MTAERETHMTDTTPEIENPEAVLAALERAKSDAKKYRESAEALQAEVTALQTSTDEMKAVIQSVEDGDSEWKNKAKELLVREALDKTNADRVLKFLDLASIDFDEEGQLAGLDDAVAKVKSDLPELFDVKRSVGGEADQFTKQEAKPEPSDTDVQMARLFNK